MPTKLFGHLVVLVLERCILVLDSYSRKSVLAQLCWEVNAENATKKVAIDVKDVTAITEHQNKAQRLIQEKPLYQKSDLQMVNSGNAHCLVNDKVGQVAVDVPQVGADSRGFVRATFDHGGLSKNGEQLFKFAGYTTEHDYSKIPCYGQGDYYEVHQHFDNELTATNAQVNNLMCGHATEVDQEKKKKKKRN